MVVQGARLDASSRADHERSENEKNRAADERRGDRDVIEKQASECAAQHDRELDRSDHQSAAALRFVADAFASQLDQHTGIAEFMAPHAIMAGATAHM